MSRLRSLGPLVLLLALAGCRAVVGPPEGAVDRREVYQAIANALPRADFGWGDPPGVVRLAASVKREGGGAPLPPLKADEHGFRVRYAVYRPRCVDIPYAAIEEVAYEYRPLPNVLFAALLVLPLQIGRATVVFDANRVPGLVEQVKKDLRRLEAVGREVGLGGPWAHAQEIKWKIASDAEAYGTGRLALHFDFPAGVPAWIPFRGRAGRVAEAFAWAAAHPDAPPLPDDVPDRGAAEAAASAEAAEGGS
ncbi:MAG: hypothetical protein D6731_18505 [Planctomycetota bacterium]|nr:MAG: hypothetical protein D6731_18505 [Planctomycetota bacterium]